MKKNGYTTVELLVVLAIFSIGYFTATWVISGYFGGNFNQELYKEKISAIEKQASIYAQANEDLFAEEKTAYVTINDLVKQNAVIANEKGEVTDPRNSDNNLNDIKIKLTKDDEKVVAKALV